MSNSITLIPAADTHPLRQQILRPHQPLSEMSYPGDDAPDTFHLGAFHDGALVGIASFYRETRPSRPTPADTDWRLRGMATTPEVRGRGFGRALLEASFTHILDAGGTHLWCNGRLPAVPFYQKLGFEILGDVFELPGIGPHVVLEIEIETGAGG